MAREAGARDAAHVSVLLSTVRRKFKRILKSIVAETLSEESDAEMEIEYLMELLAHQE